MSTFRRCTMLPNRGIRHVMALSLGVGVIIGAGVLARALHQRALRRQERQELHRQELLRGREVHRLVMEELLERAELDDIVDDLLHDQVEACFELAKVPEVVKGWGQVQEDEAWLRADWGLMQVDKWKVAPKKQGCVPTSCISTYNWLCC